MNKKEEEEKEEPYSNKSIYLPFCLIVALVFVVVVLVAVVVIVVVLSFVCRIAFYCTFLSLICHYVSQLFSDISIFVQTEKYQLINPTCFLSRNGVPKELPYLSGFKKIIIKVPKEATFYMNFCNVCAEYLSFYT